MPETLKIAEPAPGLVVVTFSRPEAFNALSTLMGRELLEVWAGLAARADLRAVVLAGEGKHFCAGADLKERNGMTDQAWADQHKLFEDMIRAQLAVPVPVIAAVQGAAMGGGSEQALACDFIYAADNARFGLPEVGLGIMPGLGGTQNLPRAVGTRRALELLTTGLPFSAAKALDYGLVNAVYAPDDLMPKALETAGVIATKAPLSVRALKKVVRRGVNMELPAAMDFEVELYNDLFRTADRREGVGAFNEKRQAVFKGR